MLLKKLSKIGLILFLAASFFVVSPFEARADFTSTDSTNLRNVAEDTSNIYTRVGTTNTHLNNINTKLTNIYNDVGSIKNAVTNTIATTINTISSTLTSIKGYVDGIEGYIDGVETKLDNISGALTTSNGNWVTLGNYIDAMYQTMQTSDSTNTNIYNLLNTYTNNYISSIDKEIAILNDNVTQVRYRDSSQTISLTTPAGNTASYNLAGTAIWNFKIAYNENNVPYVTCDTLTRYCNWRGHLNQLLVQMARCCMFGFNTCINYLHVIEYDLAYIGTELHLTYQLIDAFKSANHTDITTFAAANHTDLVAVKTSIDNFKAAFDSWVTNWTSWAKHFYILIDNICVRRISDSADTITLETFGNGTITYTLRLYPIYNTYYDSTNKVVTRETINTYSNFNGALYRYWIYGQNAIFAYIQYVQDNSVANSISNNVAALNTNLTNYSAAEQQIQNRVQNALSTFIPDTTLFSGFVAIAWCSQYLQQVYVALGSYGTVIMIGLLLGVCMQFIGYFRYKY